MTKLRELPDAIDEFVRPRMHLNFASTPSRSNAAVRALARRFRGTDPGFCLSATGFHSTLHLLARLRLARRYVACFFGDNYPTPKPNPLYQQLLDEGATIEHWSLWTYVSALRAAAFGHPYAVTNSLAGTSLGDSLARAGQFLELPDPREPGRTLGLVSPLVPDIAFLHAPTGDAAGNVVFTPPYGEGFYGALAARDGVIVTVDRLLPPGAAHTMPHWVPLPAHRVLAVCEEPFGAHPQPLCGVPSLGLPSYEDDFEHYKRWRRIAADDTAFDDFVRRVLDAPDARAAYREFVGEARLADLARRATIPPAPPREQAESPRAPAAIVRPERAWDELDAHERAIVLGARWLSTRVRTARYRSILAGIGQSFAGARLARLLLEDDPDVELMVETGFTGFDARLAHPFLLSHANVRLAARLTSVDSVLGALTCGATNACIGAIGAAQVDETGNVNSTRVDGALLVGSGGANDIAASAREVVVFSRLDRHRLVPRVEYVTSVGRNVRAVVTEECVFERDGAHAPWHVRELVRGELSLRALADRCTWAFRLAPELSNAPPPTPLELEFVLELRAQSGRANGAQEERRP